MTNVVEMLQFNEKLVAEPQKSGKLYCPHKIRHEIVKQSVSLL